MASPIPRSTKIDQEPTQDSLPIGKTDPEPTDKRKLQIAYLGPPASFSHQAAVDIFPPETAIYHPLKGFEEIFGAVQGSSFESGVEDGWKRSLERDENGQAEGRVLGEDVVTEDIIYDYAVVPVENSTNGDVIPVRELLRECFHGGRLRRPKAGLTEQKNVNGTSGSEDTDSNIQENHHNNTNDELKTGPKPSSKTSRFPDVEAIDEYKLSVHHYLYTHATPTQSTPTITSLLTHPQVWTQCTSLLTQLPSPPHQHISTTSTSEAARLVSLDSSGESAAICSQLAGEMWGLKLLRERVEDDKEGDGKGGNRTTFWVLRNRRR